MEKRPLDVTILSAKGLKDIGTFSKMDVYVAVSLSSDPRSEQKTPVDTDGGSSPKWNYGPMKFTLDESEVQMNRISIEFRLKHERKLMGDREVGELRVPVKELLDRAYDGRGDEPVEYPVRKHNSDKVHGSIKFSYKFGEVYKIENTAYATQRMLEPYPQPAPGNYGAPLPAGYPASGSYAPPQPAYAAPYAPPPTGYSQPPPVAGGYGYGGYQPPPPAGYPQPGYPGVYQQPGYPGAYQQPGYPGGYPGVYQQPPQKPQRGGGMGTGAAVGLGVAGGLVGGLLIGEMIDDSNDNAYDAGYDAGFDDGGDF